MSTIRLTPSQRLLLDIIASRQDNWRDGVYPARKTNDKTANVLVEHGLLFRHTQPHAGYRVTDAGHALRAANPF